MSSSNSSSGSNRTSNAQLNDRIGHLESQTSRIDAELGAVRNDLQSIIASQQGFQHEVRTFMQSSGKFDPRLLATAVSVALAAVGLVLTIGAMSMGPTVERLNKLESKNTTLQEWRIDTAANRWTRDDQDEYARRIDLKHAGAVEDLDETLQREMRLLDNALQREMRMLLDGPMARLEALEQAVDKGFEQDDILRRKMEVHLGETHVDIAAGLSALRGKVSELERLAGLEKASE